MFTTMAPARVYLHQCTVSWMVILAENDFL
jgi:hypothetical protein